MDEQKVPVLTLNTQSGAQQALEQAVQEEENAAIIATVRKFELSPEELALALEELRHNVVAPSLEAKAKQDKEQMEEEEIDEEAELPQD